MQSSCLVLIALTACAIEPEYGEVDQAVELSNRLASNRLASNRLASNRLASNKLSVAALPANAGAGSSPLVDRDDGRDVMSYIVGCALPSGKSMSVTASNGQVYKFNGLLGLAPAWADRAPTVSERRWVTACVLARTNLYGTPVMLSMRGSHSALATTNSEIYQYELIDGAFYGDLFDPNGPKEYACDGSSRTGDSDPTSHTLRACADSDDAVTTKCGFTATGTCWHVCTTGNVPYKGCPAGYSRYNEVITVTIDYD